MKDWTLQPLLCKRSYKLIVTVPFGLKNPCMYVCMNEYDSEIKAETRFKDCRSKVKLISGDL